MRIDDFDYDLPEELIALQPAHERDGSRLMHIRRDSVGHYQFTDLPNLLREGDLLVVNDTKVFPAALLATRGARATGGGGDVQVNINLLEIITSDSKVTTWRAFARPAKRIRPGDELTLRNGMVIHVSARHEAEIELTFSGDKQSVMDALDEVGDMPLPPYIARKRPLMDVDRERYQTLFAKARGSVAAPTAGLHFTDDVFAALRARQIETVSVTLHVGAGTFLPVTSDDLSGHKMHAEWGEVTTAAANKIARAKREGRRIICVGTTSARLLESAVSLGGEIVPWAGATDIFIMPGFRFRIVDALVTNFHLPKSTLLMLISALAGIENIQHAYAQAVLERYRFFSYGDACLIEKQELL